MGDADRQRWNQRYRTVPEPSFAPHPLAVTILVDAGLDLPAGPVLELACGLSGSALLAARTGRQVTAVDVSEVALARLGDRIRRDGSHALINLVNADLDSWRPKPDAYALVLCTGFWARDVFAAASRAVIAGGVLAWESFTQDALRGQPSLPATWYVGPGEPASLLPAGFTVLLERDLAANTNRQLIARRAITQ